MQLPAIFYCLPKTYFPTSPTSTTVTRTVFARNRIAPPLSNTPPPLAHSPRGSTPPATTRMLPAAWHPTAATPPPAGGPPPPPPHPPPRRPHPRRHHLPQQRPQPRLRVGQQPQVARPADQLARHVQRHQRHRGAAVQHLPRRLRVAGEVELGHR